MPITTPPDRVELYENDPDHFLHVIDYLFRPAIEQAGFKVIKPAFNNSEVIQGEIIRHLETADLVLCDISGWNANVFFELGIRVALDKPVAMVRDTQTPSIPFDNNPLAHHQYDARMTAWCVEAEIPRLRTVIEAAGRQKQNALWRYFSITQRAKESDPGDPTQAMLEVLSTRMSTIEGVLRRATRPPAVVPTEDTVRSQIGGGAVLQEEVRAKEVIKHIVRDVMGDRRLLQRIFFSPGDEIQAYLAVVPELTQLKALDEHALSRLPAFNVIFLWDGKPRR